MKGPEFACDLLKLCRGRWVARTEIALELDVKQDLSDRWVEEYERQGILIRRTSETKGRTGFAPQVYTLAPEWGGRQD